MIVASAGVRLHTGRRVMGVTLVYKSGCSRARSGRLTALDVQSHMETI